MNNKLILEAIASDLKRVSLSLQRGSRGTAARFAQEVMSKKDELDLSSLDAYVKKLISKLGQATKDPEDALMYSTLLQNFALRHYSLVSS